MGITNTTSKIGYAGDDATVAFTFPFKVFATSQVEVIVYDTVLLTETVKTLGSHYSVTLNSGEGGTVTMTTAPTADEEIYILKNIPFTQPDTISKGATPAATIEQIADRVTMLTQQLEEQINRVPALRKTTDQDQPVLPDPVDGELLGWGAGGNIANYSTSTLDTGTPVLDEDNMASNSAVAVPTQQSVKAYVDRVEDIVDLKTTFETYTAAASNVGLNERHVFFTAASADYTLELTDVNNLNVGDILVLRKSSNDSDYTVTIQAAAGNSIQGYSNVTMQVAGERYVLMANSGSTWDMVTHDFGDLAPAARCYVNTGGQNLVTGTVIDFDTVEYDTTDSVTTGASWKYTAKARGLYQVNIFLNTAAATAAAINSWLGVRLSLNGGAASTYITNGYATVTASIPKNCIGSTVLKLAKGDYISFVGSNLTGQTHTISTGITTTHVTIARIGDYTD